MYVLWATRRGIINLLLCQWISGNRHGEGWCLLMQMGDQAKIDTTVDVVGAGIVLAEFHRKAVDF